MNDPIAFFLTVCVGVIAGRLLATGFLKNCILSGHDFQNNGNVDICSKCQLIKRKVKK